jgi:hypothetical protein
MPEVWHEAREEGFLTTHLQMLSHRCGCDSRGEGYETK